MYYGTLYTLLHHLEPLLSDSDITDGWLRAHIKNYFTTTQIMMDYCNTDNEITRRCRVVLRPYLIQSRPSSMHSSGVKFLSK